MYNIHLATKIKRQLKKQRVNRLKQHYYLQKYANQVQPKLLDSYNKRINTFMRKMEESPIVLNIQLPPHKQFRNLNEREKFLGASVFRFKDHNDWNSIYTEMQRSQRKNNEKYMEQKFGDSTLAYRSIVSQSQYTPSSKHQFRLRTKLKEINPPMKYVCSVPKIMVRKFNNQKNNLKIKTQGQEDESIMEKRKSTKQTQMRSKNNKSLVSKNSHLFEQDNRSIRSFKSTLSFADSVVSKNNESQVNEQNQEQKNEKEEKKYLSPKMHFKTLIETFQQTPDFKVKQGLRQVLVKCGIFRQKDKKALIEQQIDKLSFQIDNHSVKSLHIPLKDSLHQK